MNLEQAYAGIVKPVVDGTSFAWRLRAALTQAYEDEARLARARIEEQARARVQANLRALRPAVARLTDVDLDSAWRAALRGDQAVLDARVLPQVRTGPVKRTPKGTPWRASGWLRAGASKRS